MQHLFKILFSNNFFTKVYYLLAICILIIGCATPATPIGGQKDIQAPILVSTTPEDKTLNFSNKSISFVFDENISIDNPLQKVFISPKLETSPKIEVRKNELTIPLDEKLRPNTTYTIAFGDAIKDLNEGNVYNNLSYTFSTGASIDSGKVKGIVVAENDIPDNTFVVLYDTVDAQIIKKQKPLYVYKVAKDGVFTFDHLNFKNYRLFVLTDKNNNFIYDLPNEQIGFVEQEINISDTTNDITIKLFEEENISYSVKEYTKKSSNNLVRIVANIPESYNHLDINIANINGNLPVYKNKVSGNTFDFVLSDSGSQSYIVYFDDSIVDTISVELEKKTHYPYIKDKTHSSTFMYKNDLPVFNTTDTIELAFKNATSIFLNKIKLLDTSGVLVKANYFIEGGFLKFFIPEKKSQQLLLVIPDSTIQYLDWELHYNSLDTFKFYTIEDKNLGSLNFLINPNDSQQLIFELYGNNKLLDKKIIKDSMQLKYLSLLPINYSYKIIWDKNKNERRDAGNLTQMLQPEPLYLSKETIVVKPNWEQEIDIKPNWDYYLKTTNTTKNIGANPGK